MTRWQAWNIRLGALCAGIVLSQASMAANVVSLTPVPASPVAGTSFSFDVKVAGAVDLYAYQFTLNFDPTKLRATTGTEGSFLTSVGTTSFGMGTIDNTAGTISYSYDSLIGAIAGASGAGTLARYTFSALSAGVTAVTFSDALFLNSTLTDIPTTTQNLSLTISAVPEPATLALFGIGLAGVAMMRRRKAETV